jgi:hypothetical protein
VQEHRRRRILILSAAAAVASLVIALACILFVVLGGLRLFVTAVQAPPAELQLIPGTERGTDAGSETG